MIWNWLKYLSDRRNQLARERLDAYAGLLAALHKLNNAHQLDPGATNPSEPERQSGRDARDEVWRHQARIYLIAPGAIRTATEVLVAEYQSSSLDLDDKRRQPIDRARRKELREAFLRAARADLPGVK